MRGGGWRWGGGLGFASLGITCFKRLGFEGIGSRDFGCMRLRFKMAGLLGLKGLTLNP